MEIPKSVLVVEDDLGTLTLIGIMLERGGFEVVKARNAREGLHALQSHSPNLLIVDATLPGMDGVEMIREVRRDPHYEALPTILLDTWAHSDTFDRGLHAGVTDYLLKPVLHHDMSQKISEMLAKQAVEPLPPGGALLMHGTYPEPDYMSQFCKAVSARISAPVIALPSRRDGGGRNRNLREALRTSRSLTVCMTSETRERDYVRFAYEFFAEHGKALTAIMVEDIELPDAFNTCPVYKPDELAAYCDWLARIHIEARRS